MTSMMMSGGSHHPRDSVDPTQRQAIEHLAQFVKRQPALEQVVRDRSRDDPKFRFDAHHVDSEHIVTLSDMNYLIILTLSPPRSYCICVPL